MENSINYIVSIFVIVMMFVLAIGGAAMLGGKFHHLQSRLVDVNKPPLKWKRKGLLPF